MPDEDGLNVMKKNGITLTLGQIVAGSLVGLVGGWVCLLIFDDFIWQVLLGNNRPSRLLGRFTSSSLPTKLTRHHVRGLVIVGASEITGGLGIRFVSQKFGVNIPLKPLCSGLLF